MSNAVDAPKMSEKCGTQLYYELKHAWNAAFLQTTLRNMFGVSPSPYDQAAAQYDCGLYEQARRSLGGQPATQQNAALMERIQQRLRESESFCYDMEALRPQIDGCHVLHVGDYRNPSCALRQSPEFGKHFVALEDIQIGELLLIEKPFYLVYKSIIDGKKDNHHIPIYHDPKELERYMQQFVGKDTLDKASHNSFGAADNLGLFYTQASFFNHSCDFNAHWHCVCNLIVVVAARKIEAGEQIFVGYFDALVLDHEKFEHYGFVCKCNFCQNRMLLVVDKHYQLVTRHTQTRPEPRLLEEHLEELYGLEANLGMLRFRMLWDVTQWFALNQQTHPNTIPRIQRFLAEVGISVEHFDERELKILFPGVVDALIILAVAFKTQDSDALFHNCVEIARRLFRLLSGGFQDVYARVCQIGDENARQLWRETK